MRCTNSVLDIGCRYDLSWIGSRSSFSISTHLSSLKDREPSVVYPWLLNLLPEGRALATVGSMDARTKTSAAMFSNLRFLEMMLLNVLCENDAHATLVHSRKARRSVPLRPFRRSHPCQAGCEALFVGGRPE